MIITHSPATVLPLVSKGRGFTLVELLVTIAVLSVLMGIAVPALNDTLSVISLNGQQRNLADTLHYARSQALNTGTTVGVCGSTSQTNCTGGWADGWIVFMDDNEDGGFDDGETILRVHDDLGVTTVASAPAIILFSYSGSASNVSSEQSLVLCRTVNGSAIGKKVLVLPTGRVVAASDNGAC